MPATTRTYKEQPQLPILFFGSKSFGFPNTYQPKCESQYFSFQSRNIRRPSAYLWILWNVNFSPGSVTTSLSTLLKIHNHTLSYRRSFLPVPVNPAEKLVRFLHSFLPDPSSYSYITYALQRHRPQFCTWENCGMANGVVVVKSCIPEKALFSVPPLSLSPLCK